MRNISILIAASALLAGCATNWAADPAFGRALTDARAAQVVNPDAPSRAKAAPVADGQAAKSAVDRYQKSFDSPPAPVNVLNIGIGGSASGSGSQ